MIVQVPNSYSLGLIILGFWKEISDVKCRTRSGLPIHTIVHACTIWAIYDNNSHIL